MTTRPSAAKSSPHLNVGALLRREEGGAWTVKALAQRPLKANRFQGCRKPLGHDPHCVGLCIDAVPAGEAPSRDRAVGIGEDGVASPQIVLENVQINGLQEAW